MIQFRIDMQPVAKGRPRFASRGKFAVAYTDAKTREAEDNFAAQAVRYKPQTPIEGAIRLTLTFASVKPKSKPKNVKHWTTRPDLDNFIKLVKDALNKIFWKDDSQIVEIDAKKIYDESPYIQVVIEELKDIDPEQKKIV